MTVKEFIEYMLEEIARGAIKPEANLLSEYMEETGDVEDYYKDDNGNVHMKVET